MLSSALPSTNCHHEEGFSPTRDLLFRGGGRSKSGLVDRRKHLRLCHPERPEAVEGLSLARGAFPIERKQIPRFARDDHSWEALF